MTSKFLVHMESKQTAELTSDTPRSVKWSEHTCLATSNTPRAIGLVNETARHPNGMSRKVWRILESEDLRIHGNFRENLEMEDSTYT